MRRGGRRTERLTVPTGRAEGLPLRPGPLDEWARDHGSAAAGGRWSGRRQRGPHQVRPAFVNRTAMFHPMHLHGHTFALAGGGARKDTVLVVPNRTVTVDLDATNPGQWMTHCHNVYHAETGMMTRLAYQA